MIHVYGDSHSGIYHYFKRVVLDYKYIESTTMYSCDIEKYKHSSEIKPGDVMIFVYGRLI